ncbi:TAXI family TRAP transporter solute-binding subunit [Bacillus thermotolerans]|uniref:TRAP transporter solute receptor n=1 Tax=Bacillus thermotolerans TaxID=1221996 RepID=A0A0F5I2X7_BACTR|nr:TAXI family TRAP transporter solute-binding subunit [Bacillus thermotolerans]KKB38272.1 TRAP transporter solute receptor protein [Bacillus thermotolerans]KKB39818.1 TRAP transporter solute receptor [Bacillus thermotolerans]KKB44256.1 TRAP transporter solute receptor protein [Bacillus thermotolerans]
MKKRITFVLILSLSLIIAACGNSAENGQAEGEAAASGPLSGQTVTILTGGTSGIYFQVGNALAKVYGEELGAQTSAQTTGASAENTSKLYQEKAELGFAMADTVTDAYNGEGNFAKVGALSNVRAVASLYPNYLQIVAPKDLGIERLEDLKGKDIAVGALGSGTEIMAKRVLEGAGLTYDDINADFLSFSEGIEGIKNGTTDAAFLSSGYPNSGIMELAATDEVEIIPVPKELTEKLQKKYPAFDVGVIPAGTYEGVAEERDTVKVNNLLITHEGVPEEHVYEMTKALFENLDDLRNAHSSAKQITLENAVSKLPLPLHPGAEKYFKEQGVLQETPSQ